MSKPPKGALVKSQGAERLGNGASRMHQVGVKKLNVNEPLKRSREVATFSQKPRSMRRGDKHNGNLFTGYAAGVLQRARALLGAYLRNSGTSIVMLRERHNRNTLKVEYQSAILRRTAL